MNKKEEQRVSTWRDKEQEYHKALNQNSDLGKGREKLGKARDVFTVKANNADKQAIARYNNWLANVVKEETKGKRTAKGIEAEKKRNRKKRQGLKRQGVISPKKVKKNNVEGVGLRHARIEGERVWSYISHPNWSSKDRLVKINPPAGLAIRIFIDSGRVIKGTNLTPSRKVGWSYRITIGNEEEYSDYEENQGKMANQIALFGLIKALQYIKETGSLYRRNLPIVVYSSSDYLLSPLLLVDKKPELGALWYALSNPKRPNYTLWIRLGNRLRQVDRKGITLFHFVYVKNQGQEQSK